MYIITIIINRYHHGMIPTLLPYSTELFLGYYCFGGLIVCVCVCVCVCVGGGGEGGKNIRKYSLCTYINMPG